MIAAVARTTTVVETVTCDVCDQPVKDPQTLRIGLGRGLWELDLCAKDHTRVSKQIDELTARGRRVARPAGRRDQARRGDAGSDWDYLESLGFKRHRGRKSAEEIAALRNRK